MPEATSANMLTALESRLAALPQIDVTADCGDVTGPLEAYRHALSQGAIGPEPLPDNVIDAVRKLRPRLIRIFIQEFMNIYPERGRHDWSRLDAYIGALAGTGAKIVAAICIKPRVLFPELDQNAWRPNDVAEWQEVIKALVHRYSVEQDAVTHWEFLNETNSVGGGGAPYTIPSAEDYFEFYRLTTDAILEAAPGVRVGGPAVARGPRNEPLPGFVDLCKKHGTRLDFVSWHDYESDPEIHVRAVEFTRELVADMNPMPELFITEWNKRWAPVRLVELDDDPGWAANVTSIAISLLDAGLDWGFYYRIWDRPMNPADHERFKPRETIARQLGNMNMRPHRLGMLDEHGKARSHYFAIQALSRLRGNRVATTVNGTTVPTAAGGVQAISSTDDGGLTAIIVSEATAGTSDRIVNFAVDSVEWTKVRYTLRRIDRDRRWNPETHELHPVEQRTFWAYESKLNTQFVLPGGAVALVEIESVE